MRKEKTLFIIVPCYNEEETIEYAANKLLEKLEDLKAKDKISDKSKICFVNDGSDDNTAEILNQLANADKKISIIHLSRNFGQQYALLAGIKTVSADMVITFDADLQDSINSIDEMIERYHEGYEIVFGCKKKRLGDTFLKKFTAELFYKVFRLLCPRMNNKHSEYRLLSKKAIELIKEHGEKNIFLRGIVNDIGLKSTTVLYDRIPRQYGQTKWNYLKLMGFAWAGITNYSIFPLRLIVITGIIFISTTLFTIPISLINFNKLSLIISFMCLFSGLTILSIGIVAEYIAKIFYEVKGRPAFQIESTKNL